MRFIVAYILALVVVGTARLHHDADRGQVWQKVNARGFSLVLARLTTFSYSVPPATADRLATAILLVMFGIPDAPIYD
jgi:hypothetical protein